MPDPLIIMPSPAHVESSSFAYLRDAARYFTGVADRLVAGFTECGTTADAEVVRAAADRLHHAAGIAAEGYQRLQARRSAVLAAIGAAQFDEFAVGADYRLLDNRPVAPTAERRRAAEQHAEVLQHRLAGLITADRRLADALGAATAGLGEVQFDGPGDG